MVDRIQTEAHQEYSRRIHTKRNLVTTAGRYPGDAKKLPEIWKDIQEKLRIGPDMSVLDIGCGYGGITVRCLENARRHNWHLTMMDIPEVIQAVRQDFFNGNKSSAVKFVPGIFPDQFPSDWKKAQKQFDRILIYSVLHYTSHPLRMIDAAVKCLAPGGRLLFGDIPNLSKKGRFLASKEGRCFDAAYKNIPLAKTPQYKNAGEFVRVAQKQSRSPLVDSFLLSILRRYRSRGYDCMLLPQPDTLPFCYTREDLLIRRYD